ncbi:hypothetical protein R84981_001130 [Carnimonas sp. R-84981]|uniref:phage tail protein I n=1 Tax=Carnimonas bestiolae TaxID=3402172 RepID=UPI003EDBA313
MSDQSLLPPNATDAENAIALTIARISRIPTPINTVWSPENCPVELLPWLAWALNLQTWDSTWPEHLKRRQVASAVDIARRKGTAKSVRDVIASFGSSVALREWWQLEPKGEPYTFAITLTLGSDVPQTAQFQEQIMQAVDRAKPVRAHYTLTAGLKGSAGIGAIAVARPFVYRRLEMEA